MSAESQIDKPLSASAFKLAAFRPTPIGMYLVCQRNPEGAMKMAGFPRPDIGKFMTTLDHDRYFISSVIMMEDR